MRKRKKNRTINRAPSVSMNLAVNFVKFNEEQFSHEPLSLDYCYGIVVDLMVASVVLVAVGIVVAAAAAAAAGIAAVDTVVADTHPRTHLLLVVAMLRLTLPLILRG